MEISATENGRVLCPVCGRVMRQVRRGATLQKHGPAYICPEDEAETQRDERGHLHRVPDAVHQPGLRVWDAAALLGLR